MLSFVAGIFLLQNNYVPILSPAQSHSGVRKPIINEASARYYESNGLSCSVSSPDSRSQSGEQLFGSKPACGGGEYTCQ